MKKKLLLLIILLTAFFFSKNINKSDASPKKDYTAFPFINVDSGNLLRNYSKETINNELYRVRKPKFIGWNIHKFNSNVRATFVTESLFSYKNEGTSPITYTLNIAKETTSKTSVSATDRIEIQVGQNGKEFKGSFSDELKISADYTTTELVKEQQNLSIVVDPGTICVGYVEGQGYYTNGIACYYVFWLENQIGAFEYFTITESYLRIEKLSL